ncbi:MAG: PhoH family protein, partial [Victivallales bacterium]|nr:PhoH family protein [Victivallales bacterium]
LGHFPDSELVLPLEVIEELDHFKHGGDETARNARRAAIAFDRLRTHGSLKEGVMLENGAVVRVCASGADGRHSGEALLALARKYSEEGREATIVTKSVNLRVKADVLGLTAVDYGQETPLDTEKVKGWRRLEMPPESVAMLKSGMAVKMPSRPSLHENEYVFAHEPDNPKIACCARCSTAKEEIAPLADVTRRCCGVHSLNIEQTFALDALLDPSIVLVTLAGRAGTGKTLLAMAAALQQIFGDRRYEKLLVFRPTMPVSRDLGYLPGDVNDKMRPWMQPVYDALELIRSMDRKEAARSLPNDVMNCPEISVEPLTYIRGRSIPNQFIIIDEAQNLTPLEVKTAITRVGSGSKIVLTGDPAQIDNPYVDSLSNGLTRLVGSFLDSPLGAHVTLTKGERSELAETAAALL